MLEWVAPTAADLGALGERLGRALGVGDVVGLIGPLGAGKTTFVQGMARGMGIGGRHVASPTFRRSACTGDRITTATDIRRTTTGRVNQGSPQSSIGIALTD